MYGHMPGQKFEVAFLTSVKSARAASRLLGNACALAARGGVLYVAIVLTDQECSRKRSRLSIVQCSSGCWATSNGAPQSSSGI